MNTTPPPVVIPVAEPFLSSWLYAFRDNEFQNITEATFRNFATDIDGKFARLDSLNTNQVRGAVFRVPYVQLVNGVPTVPIALIPARFRIQGMDVLAINGTDQTSTAGGVKADPIDFRLIANTAGTIDALVDEKGTTTATVKCAFVRTSGTNEEKVASFPVFILEDHAYKAADVFQYTFPGGQTRLLEVINDLNQTQNPLPTGLDSDPNYKSFAPLTSGNGGISQASFDALDDRVALTEQGVTSLQGNVNQIEQDISYLFSSLPGKVEVWQPGPKTANRVYLLIGGIGTGFYQPKADIGNSSSVSLQYYNRVAYLPTSDVEAALVALENQVVNLTTDEVAEGNNLYFTERRALDAGLENYALASNADSLHDGLSIQDALGRLEYRLFDVESAAPVVLPTSRVLWVQGGGQVGGLGTVGNPFTSVPAAQNAAQDGDIIRVLPGGTATDALGRRCYPNVTIITKNVFIVCDPGVVFSGVWNVGNFNGFAPVNARIWGGEWLSELSLLRQGNGASFLQVEQARFTGLGYFLAFGRPNGGNYLDVATLRNCYFNSLMAGNTSGPVQIFGRDDAQQQMQVVLDSCTVISQNAPCVTFSANPLSRLVLQGSTELRALAGQLVYNPIQTAPSNSVYPVSQWLVDERPTAAGPASPGAATGGIDYANPVLHSAGVTLTVADCGKHHVFTGTGQALWTVQLPDPVAAAGKQISIRVANGASGMWAFQAADIDGVPERRLHNAEVAFLTSDGTSWHKQSGRSIALSYTLGFNPSTGGQTLNAQAYPAALEFTQMISSNAPADMFYSAARGLRALRPGLYVPALSAYAVSSAGVRPVEVLASVNGDFGNPRSTDTACPITLASDGYYYTSLQTSANPISLLTDDYLSILIYTDTTIVLQNGGAIRPKFSLTEIIDW